MVFNVGGSYHCLSSYNHVDNGIVHCHLISTISIYLYAREVEMQ